MKHRKLILITNIIVIFCTLFLVIARYPDYLAGEISLAKWLSLVPVAIILPFLTFRRMKKFNDSEANNA